MREDEGAAETVKRTENGCTQRKGNVTVTTIVTVLSRMVAIVFLIFFFYIGHNGHHDGAGES